MHVHNCIDLGRSSMLRTVTAIALKPASALSNIASLIALEAEVLQILDTDFQRTLKICDQIIEAESPVGLRATLPKSSASATRAPGSSASDINASVAPRLALRPQALWCGSQSDRRGCW
jgi:hypothetical protein